MNVMIADIGRKPCHDRARFHETGGFQRGFVVSPAGIVVKRHARKVVLGVKQVSSNSVRDEVRNDLSQQQRRPAKEISNRHRDHDVYHERDQAIKVFARIIDERIKTHPVEKRENIPEQDGQWMTHKQVLKSPGLR